MAFPCSPLVCPARLVGRGARFVKIHRVTKLSARFDKQRFKARELFDVPRVGGEIIQFIRVVSQVEELRVSDTASVVSDEFPTLITNHALAIHVGAKKPVS